LYNCNPLAAQLCEDMATAQPNKWYFASATASARELGFWLPGGDDAAPNPALPGGKKDVTQCKNVYTAMINAVWAAPSEVDRGDGKSAGAADGAGWVVCAAAGVGRGRVSTCSEMCLCTR